MDPEEIGPLFLEEEEINSEEEEIDPLFRTDSEEEEEEMEEELMGSEEEEMDSEEEGISFRDEFFLKVEEMDSEEEDILFREKFVLEEKDIDRHVLEIFQKEEMGSDDKEIDGHVLESLEEEEEGEEMGSEIKEIDRHVLESLEEEEEEEEMGSEEEDMDPQEMDPQNEEMNPHEDFFVPMELVRKILINLGDPATLARCNTIHTSWKEVMAETGFFDLRDRTLMAAVGVHDAEYGTSMRMTTEEVSSNKLVLVGVEVLRGSIHKLFREWKPVVTIISANSRVKKVVNVIKSSINSNPEFHIFRGNRWPQFVEESHIFEEDLVDIYTGTCRGQGCLLFFNRGRVKRDAPAAAAPDSGAAATL